MNKYILTFEFRYRKIPSNPVISEHVNKIVTIGIYETLEEAVEVGNQHLQTLSKTYEVRPRDKFELKGESGRSFPNLLVTNTCYARGKSQYFGKITKLSFQDIESTIQEVERDNNEYRDTVKLNS